MVAPELDRTIRHLVYSALAADGRAPTSTLRRLRSLGLLGDGEAIVRAPQRRA
jgi:hypothetical protein